MPLIVVPTPVGNMRDVTVRALEELKKADFIACEDTRHTGIFLKHYGIDGKLMSCHEHNEASRSQEILDRLSLGERVCLVSDAGTPGISDPGSLVIKKALESGYQVTALPGATAFVPGLLLSGLEAHPCLFYGFLPDRETERLKVLESIKDFPWTVVFYVSPHKIEKHLKSIEACFGDRKAAMIREISKIHEEAFRGTVGDIIKRAKEGVKGEIVLVVEGKAPIKEPPDWRAKGKELLSEGLSEKDTVRVLSEDLGVPKNTAKKWIIEIKKAH